MINFRSSDKHMKKALFIILGSISLIIGVVGIIVPGLPTTTFLLITAALYVRSSDRLYNWLLDHKILGRYIRDYRKYRAITRNMKIYSISIMWIMILISALFFIENIYIRILLLLCAITGTFIVLRVPTLKKDYITGAKGVLKEDND